VPGHHGYGHVTVLEFCS